VGLTFGSEIGPEFEDFASTFGIVSWMMMVLMVMIVVTVNVIVIVIVVSILTIIVFILVIVLAVFHFPFIVVQIRRWFGTELDSLCDGISFL
jgi:hypothetical protein